MVLGFSSASSLATLSWPSYSLASSSTIGAIILHGPHHSAQKSTSTSSFASSTSDSNVSSVTANGFAILLLLLSLDEFDSAHKTWLGRRILRSPAAYFDPTVPNPA